MVRCICSKYSQGSSRVHCRSGLRQIQLYKHAYMHPTTWMVRFVVRNNIYNGNRSTNCTIRLVAMDLMIYYNPNYIHIRVYCQTRESTRRTAQEPLITSHIGSFTPLCGVLVQKTRQYPCCFCVSRYVRMLSPQMSQTIRNCSSFTKQHCRITNILVFSVQFDINPLYKQSHLAQQMTAGSNPCN